MGSTTLLDIIGSMLVSGILLLAALRMNEQANVNTFESQANLTVQQNLTSIINNIEWDFRKTGYCGDPNAQPKNFMYIVHGDTSDITFVGDLDDNGTLDTIRWYQGATPIAGTANPRVRMLYRTINGAAPYEANLGVTQFYLRYFDTNGDTVSTPFDAPSTVKLIEVTVRVEATALYNATYSDTTSNFSVWRETRLASRNLQAR